MRFTSNSKGLFEDNINTLQESKTIVAFLKDQKVSIDYSDLLRWQWVQTVSAMDKFFHDLIIDGIAYRIAQNKLTNRISSTQFSFSLLSSLENSSDLVDKFVDKLANYSMQNSRNIADSLSFVWPQKHKWTAICNSSNSSIDLKVAIDLIASRRNQIVHQADFQNESLARSSISEADVVNCQKVVQKIVSNTFELLSRELNDL